jgi:hypothetical protein
MKRVKTKPHLVIRIKVSWRFDPKTSRFLSEGKQSVETRSDLPPHSHVRYRMPQLAAVRKETLGKDEANLARYFNVILPSGSDPSEFVKVVTKWPCVEEVEIPPEVGLPNQP